MDRNVAVSERTGHMYVQSDCTEVDLPLGFVVDCLSSTMKPALGTDHGTRSKLPEHR